MTTPAAVPQGTSSRSPNGLVAAGHSAVPGGRLRGEAPGRRTSRLVPASPATSRLGAFTNSRPDGPPSGAGVNQQKTHSGAHARRAPGREPRTVGGTCARPSAVARRPPHRPRRRFPREPALGRDGVVCAGASDDDDSSVSPSSRGPVRGGITHSVRVPWLILPVVICLSQRLSHACLSASRIKVKPRKAH